MAGHQPLKDLSPTSHIPLAADPALLAIVQLQNPSHRRAHSRRPHNIDDTIPTPNIPSTGASEPDEPCEVCSRVNFDDAFRDGSTWSRRRWSISSAGANSQCRLCQILHWMLRGTAEHEQVKDGYAFGHLRVLNDDLYGLSFRFSHEPHSEYDESKDKLCSRMLLPVRAGAAVDMAANVFNPELVRGWLSHCDGHHNCLSLTQPAPGWSNSDLRLIDVQDWCVAPAPEKAQYVALSYVWGPIKQFCLTTDTLPQLEIPGALRSVGLPQTILDAIYVCQQLGLRFLWVDSLCIVQDSIHDANFQVNHMHVIYQQAYLTIVAADASDCSRGLSSIRPRKPFQRMDTVAGRSLVTATANLKPLEEGVRDLPWNSRAWTMQEFCLSRRCLLFTGREYFLICVNGVYVEPLTIARPEPRWQAAAVFIDSVIRPAAKTGFIAAFYADLVSLYLDRRLAYSDDILRAFQGMASALEPYLGEIWYGIPHRYFRISLCWMDHDSSVRRPGVPSWSWAGWTPTETAPPRLGRHAFPSDSNRKFWPMSKVYRWTTPSTMEPFESDYEFRSDDTVYMPSGEYDEITRWMQAAPPPLQEWPLFTRSDTGIPVNMIVTMLSYIIKLDLNCWSISSAVKRTSPTAEIPPLNKVDTSGAITTEDATVRQNHLIVGFTTLQVGTPPSRVVLLPVHVNLSHVHQEGEVRELVVQRAGNPCTLDLGAHRGVLDLAMKCIVHLH